MGLLNLVRKSANRGGISFLSGAGAVNPHAATCYFTSTDAAQALTLASGSYVGQKVRVVHAVDGGSGVFTSGADIALAHSWATVTLTNAGEWVEFEWLGNSWAVRGCSPVGILAA